MSIKIGKWEIAPQSGNAGTHQIGHKLTERHTGRNRYQKMVRAVISNPSANKEDIEVLEIAGITPFLRLNVSQTEIAYNVTTAAINGVSNAEKFKVASTDSSVTLVANTGYTVAGNEGTFTTGFGEMAEGNIAIKVSFSANNTTSSRTIPVEVSYWDGTEWFVAGTYNIIQSSSDADVSFNITPSTLPQFTKDGGTQDVSITSNVSYAIEVQGDTDTSWVTLSRVNGSASTEPLTINVAKQAVGASERELSIVFKNTLTNSVIGTLDISQAEGEEYAISWAEKTMVFTNDDVGIIKTNTLTANAEWQIEENI